MKHIILKINIFSIVFILFTGLIQAQNKQAYSIGEVYQMDSEILKEKREYIVELPDSYFTSTKKYPLVVVLDGEFNYHSHSGILKHMTQARQIPEMILVAIKNVDRVRDYTPTKYLVNLNGTDGTESNKTSGGSKQFLAFLEKELLPKIENTYRVNAFKIVVGVSHGGLLVGSSFLSRDTSFTGFISMDPSFWWDHQYIVKQLEKTDIEQLHNKRLYLTTADTFENFEGIEHVYQANLNSQERFNTELKSKGFYPGNIEFEYFKEENHWTVALLSLYHGMQFMYKDLIMKNMRTSSLEDIKKYYQTHYNGAFLPPENEINTIGYHYLKTNPEKALAFFKFNAENYPDSWNVFDSLAEGYLEINNKKEAVKNYKKSLLLNPNNENAKNAILKLNKQ